MSHSTGQGPANPRNPDLAARAAGREAMLDLEGAALRAQVVGRLIEGFNKAGEVLRTAGVILGPGRNDGGRNGDDRLVGLGYIASTTAELLRGVDSLLAGDNVYAAAALVRQLVELEYLAWAFAEDQAEAASWLQSTHEDRLARWQPRHIRQRSADRFRGKDYGLHCERGGHPTPIGCRVLISGEQDINRASQHWEAAAHGSSTWLYLIAATDAFAADNKWMPEQLVPLSARLPTREAIDAWRACDPMRDLQSIFTQRQSL